MNINRSSHFINWTEEWIVLYGTNVPGWSVNIREYKLIASDSDEMECETFEK